MAKQDYYDVLGVSRDADEAGLKKAYRRMAMKHHPDRNQGDADAEEKFKRCKEAYEILSDPQKRAAYDQYGHAGVDAASGAAGGGGFHGGGFGDVFEDIFGDIFGGGGRRGSQSGERGADLRYDLTLTLEQAVFGVTQQITVPTLVNCEHCHGSGARKGTKPQVCGTCQGAGQVRMQQGFFSVTQTCPTCRGRGKMIGEPCRPCQGQGRVQDEKILSVKVPAGVDTGDRIRLSKEGEAGSGGAPSGDLYVQIEVSDHAIFTRDGNDLYCEVPVSFTTAALGGELDVPTLDGRVRLKVSPETQTGRQFRLRGKGVSSVRSHGKGDLYCQILVETPVNLTRKQKELLKDFEQSLSDDRNKYNPKASSWFKGVKRFFEDMKF